MRVVTIRQLVYAFHALPWVIQREIAHDLRVITYTEVFDEDRIFQIRFFIRLRQMNLVETLKHRLFPDYSPVPETHPCG